MKKIILFTLIALLTACDKADSVMEQEQETIYKLQDNIQYDLFFYNEDYIVGHLGLIFKFDAETGDLTEDEGIRYLDDACTLPALVSTYSPFQHLGEVIAGYNPITDKFTLLTFLDDYYDPDLYVITEGVCVYERNAEGERYVQLDTIERKFWSILNDGKVSLTGNQYIYFR